MTIVDTAIRYWNPHAAAIRHRTRHGTSTALLIKENIEVSGFPFECGSATRPGHTGSRDASSVHTLKAAGFEPLASACCDEFGYGCTGEANPAGPCRNPHDPARMSGGSSGGAAAAVSLGLAGCALGTDTAGSVRIPAALCGVYGFKPSYGSISTQGVYPLSPSLDHVGLIAGTWHELTRMWSALRPDAHEADPRNPTLGLARETEAYGADWHVTEAWKAVHNALGTLPTASLLGWDDCQTGGSIVQAYEGFQVHKERLSVHRSGYQPEILARLESGARISAEEYMTALDAMNSCRRYSAEALGDVDAVVLPTCPVVAPPIGATNVQIGNESLSPRSALMRNTRVANYSGLAALTMPLKSAGLPVGVQIIGRSNAAVLRTGHLIRTLGLVTRNGRRSPPGPSSPPAWQGKTGNVPDA
ncbi:amidase [Pseudarthrobacter sp. YS3]|uniref:amidase n=1 Tax=Pseudarthrobacter sp. YS3 TaxID=3453718 RepID=UPI003EEC5B2F